MAPPVLDFYFKADMKNVEEFNKNCLKIIKPKPDEGEDEYLEIEKVEEKVNKK